MAYLGPPPARTPVTSAQITDASVTAAKLATDSVTTVKIAAANVTTAKITDANVTTAKITDANVTTAKLAASSALVGKNLLVNGNFSVAQRGTSFAAIADQAFSLDRWETRYSSAARVTITQDTSGVFAALGGSKQCMKIDCTTVDSSIASGDFFGIRQMVEARDCTQLAFGSAAAKAVTISFNVSSPKSGVHTLVLGNADSSRSYAAEYTVASADTAERISVTIPGDTAGTVFAADGGEGLRLVFSLLCGADNSKAAGSWGSSIFEAGANQQNLLDNTANNFFLGDVMIEVGSVATDFEQEPVSVTLTKCKRYFERTAYVNNGAISIAAAGSTTAFLWIHNFEVEKRIAPTVTFTGACYSALGGSGNSSSETMAEISVHKCRISASISSGLTAHNAILVAANGTTTIDATADL